MFCPTCGSQMADDALFCTQCGTPARQASLVGDTAQEPTAAQAPLPNEVNSAEMSHRKRGVIVIGAAAVAVIAAAIIVYLLFFAPYSVDERTFPDPVLRNAVALQCDTDADGKITRDQAKALTSLDLSSSAVASLDGIDKFPNITSLDLSGCKALSAVVSLNIPSLSSLDVSDSGVAELDVRNLAGLQALDAKGASITELDISGNERLSSLSVDDAVTVSGVDATQLREEWVTSSYERNGFIGDVDGFPTGFNQSQNETRTFEYDGQARLASCTYEEWYDDRGKSTKHEQRYAYNEDGKSAAATTIYSSSTSELTLFLNDNMQVVRETTGSKTGSSTSADEYAYEYNDLNLLVSRSSDTVSYYYAYNDIGQLTEVSYSYKSTADTTHRIDALIEYNDAGLVSRLDMARGAYEFEYDDQGRCVKRTKLWKTYGGQDYFMMDSRTDWTTLGDVAYNNPTVVMYVYDDAGRLASASSHYEYTADAGNSASSDAVCYFAFDDKGLPTQRVYHSDSARNGSESTEDASESLTYTRVFVDKDNADVLSALTVDDPFGHARFHDIRGRYYRFLADQQPLVRNIILGSCIYGFM